MFPVTYIAGETVILQGKQTSFLSSVALTYHSMSQCDANALVLLTQVTKAIIFMSSTRGRWMLVSDPCFQQMHVVVFLLHIWV